MKVGCRHYFEMINPLLFLVIVMSLFPFAISSEPAVLRMIAPGIIWVGILLATLLTLDRLFYNDFIDGTLTQMVLSPKPLSLLISAKLLAHWLLNLLPLIFVALLSALFLQLPKNALFALLISLSIGTPTLVLIGAIGRALTLGLVNSSLLVIILVLPFYIPILIFGASAVVEASHGLPFVGQIAWLTALLVLAIPLAPLATAAALRIGTNLA